MAEQTAAVPSQFNYSPIPPAVGGYVSQQKNMPSNGTVFAPGQPIEIPLVTGRVGQFIDPSRSYLMFNVKMVGAGLLLERVGAHAFFDQFEIWLNGQPLEQIWAYNAIAQLMYDLYYGVGRSDLLNFVEGCAYTSPMGVAVAGNGLWSGAAGATILGATAGQAEAIAIVSQGHYTGAGPMATSQAAAAATSAATNGALAVRGAVDMGGSNQALNDIQVDGDADAVYTSSPAGFCNFQVVSNTIITPTAVAFAAGTGPQEALAAAAGTAAARPNGRYFAIPLISGLLGTLAMKMFPALTFAPGSLLLRFRTAQPAAPGTQVTMLAASYDTRYRTGDIANANLTTATEVASTGGFFFNPYSSAAAWSLSDVTFVTTTVTLQAGVSASILSAAQSGALDLHTKSFTDVYAQVPATASTATLIIPLRKLSMNTLFVFFRDTARETGFRGGSFLSRYAPTGALSESFSWYCIFGNERIREYPYLRPVETLVENLRALHEWTDLEINFGPALRPIPLGAAAMTNLWNTDVASWVNPVGGFYGAICDNVTTSTTVVGGTIAVATQSTSNGILYTCDKWSLPLQFCGFFLSLDLDTFSGTTGTSRSGRNTTGDQITIYLDNGNANAMFPGAGRSMRADFVALHDLRINIQAGGIAVPVS
jgi:hypothetical protein